MLNLLTRIKNYSTPLLLLLLILVLITNQDDREKLTGRVLDMVSSSLDHDQQQQRRNRGFHGSFSYTWQRTAPAYAYGPYGGDYGPYAIPAKAPSINVAQNGALPIVPDINQNYPLDH